MDKAGWIDEEFVRRYEEYEEFHAPLVRDFTSSETEVRDLISFLIHKRELIRDTEIESLEAETQKLIAKIEANRKEILLEELRCFKEVLSLQRQLVNDEPRH